ncbi:uncharacterized protein L969DRAFT_20356 [Mixia osmundae IAM 14324]|uniref:Uncharacterized protein n=1 Tax=Mixia osmundae (strain CBS 9802 / IAM 14324 / JCM 22182 / KY 12970) TaxID=764103 RepID=G7DV38_MIXOS|nr:uncharacterized protein L969DRAFT_20356 [Mixia osmundae IAM 14324]KEI36335.1 hypothetical protein L969DRAFT_20356 [Mixia osmundae IAM 14324]GAA94448.1 hypothetical protein E5Q_01100 [Mixia osmundae IAM 14324]
MKLTLTMLALTLASLCSAASIDTSSMQARDANTVERRHVGSYTWCGVQIKYNVKKAPLPFGFDLAWDPASQNYKLTPTGDLHYAESFTPVLLSSGIMSEYQFQRK